MSMIDLRHSRPNRGLALTAAGIILLCAACGGDEQAGFAPPPTPIEIADVTQSAVTDRFDAVGTIEAAEAITVATEIDAIVVDLPFAEGQHINKGGLIAQLDDAQRRAAVKSAEATRDLARIAYERTEGLVEARAAAQQELDDATARLDVAQAGLDQAEVMLSKTRITAPFSGVLGTRRISPGAYLRTGNTITTLTQIKQLKVLFSVPERVLPNLTRGSVVTVSSPAYPDYLLEGTISVIDPVINPTTRGVQVIARVENENLRLRPGMSADVSVVLDTRPQALTIPDEAVFAQGAQNFVFVVNPDSSVVRTVVTLGLRLAGAVEITQGLSAGQQVVRAGHQKLYDGAKVMAVPAGAPGDAEAEYQKDAEPNSAEDN